MTTTRNPTPIKRYVVARSEDLPPGARLITDISGRSIGVFNVDGRYYALRNSCPHQGAALCSGPILGTLHAPTPGEFEYDGDRKLLICPWHNWEFELATGQSWFDPVRTKVRPYEVAIESGRALMEPDAEGRVPGPYVAETLEVELDGEYVVVRL